MKLSCVTAVFNAIDSGNRERLIRCVDSISKLKTDHEHLIYDGASTDGTVELLQELKSKTPGLVVVSESDTGIYNALNKGIRDAKGDWLYVLGCDDYVCKPEIMDRILFELPDECDVLATSVLIVDPNNKRLGIFSPCLSEIYHFPCACHQGEIIRTAVARELNGFDERYRIAADSDMFLKAHITGRRFKYETEFFAAFTSGGASSIDVQAVLKEHRTSVANVLELVGRERFLMIERKTLSLRMCRKLWNHPDQVIRNATRAMIVFRIRTLLRKWLYPIIVATRPLRHAVINYSGKRVSE